MPRRLPTLLPLLLTCAPLLAIADDGVDLEKECLHLSEHLAIEHDLHKVLKLGQARIRCGARKTEGTHVIREVTLFKMPPHESSVRLDAFTGRMLSLNVDRLPIPELKPPKGGWPSLASLLPIAQKEGEIPADSKLVKATYIASTDDGMPAGEHPYAQFVFEHVVEGAEVIGDRIVARVDLRAGHLTWLDAEQWTEVKAPDSRTTEGRALKTAKKALRRIDPEIVPCCHDPRSGQAAELAIAAAMDDKASKKKRKAKRKKRSRKRRKSGPIVTCNPELKRRVYLHDRKGKLVEAYQVSCVPTCTRAGITRQCKPNEAAMAYIGTERGKLLGMKGQIAPERYKWQRPPPPKRPKLPATQLADRGEKLLTTAIKRLEPDAEHKDSTCPPTESDDQVHRRCWHLLLPAITYHARQTRSQLVFEAPK